MFLNWMVEQFDYCSQVLTETGYFDAIEGGYVCPTNRFVNPYASRE